MTYGFQARTQIYSDSVQGLDNGQTVTLRIRPEQPVFVRRFMASKSTINPRFFVDMRLENDLPINTIVNYFDTVFGTAQRPFSVKAPIFIDEYQTLLIRITNASGLDNIALSVSLLCNPVWALPKSELPKSMAWQVRTQMYGASVASLAPSQNPVITNIRFDRRGYIWAVMGTKFPTDDTYPGVDPGALSIEYGYHTDESVVTAPARFDTVIGSGQKPLWFPQPLPVAAQQTVMVKWVNLNNEPMDADVCFQFTPTGDLPLNQKISPTL